MVTNNQITSKNCRIKKFKNIRTHALNRCPQKKAICIKLILKSPRKPNSALRKLAKVKILSSRNRVFCYIPGEGHNLQAYSTVMLRGGRVNDLPGIKYTLVRGKYDLKGVSGRKTSRSKYGTKNIRKYI